MKSKVYLISIIFHLAAGISWGYHWGWTDNALSLNGVDAWGEISTAAIPASGDFTVECWVLNSADNWATREILSQGSSGNAFYMGTDPSGHFRLGDTWGVTKVPFPTNGWHHLALVKTDDTTLFYIDGLMMTNRGVAISNPSATSFRLGRQYGTYVEHWQGAVDEVRVWNVARDEADLRAAMFEPLRGTEAGLVACWTFNEEGGTTVSNSAPTGTSLNGVLNGSAVRIESEVPFPLFARTLAPTDRTSSDAVIHGVVNAGGVDAHVFFRVVSTNGIVTTEVHGLTATNAEIALSATLRGLSPNTEYRYYIVASSSKGLVYGEDVVFHTKGLVSSLLDHGPDSLREIVAHADEGDVIYFATNGMITLTNGAIAVDKNLVVVGNGANNTKISGNATDRIFYVSSADATLSLYSVTLCNGQAPHGAQGAPGNPGGTGYPGEHGGSIYSEGSLLLSHCVVSNNAAGAGGPGGTGTAPLPTGGDGGLGGSGGGIYCLRALTLEACSFSANWAGSGGNGCSGASSGDGGQGGSGGGIFTGAGSALMISNCTFCGNAAGNGGRGFGGINVGSAGGSAGSGGGIFLVGSLEMTSSTLSGNLAGRGGNGGDGRRRGGNGGAGGHGGGIYHAGTASASLRNSLLAMNVGGSGGSAGSGDVSGTLGEAGTGVDLCGAFISVGHNLVGQIDGCSGMTHGVNGDLAGTASAPIDPMLKPMAVNSAPDEFTVIMAHIGVFPHGYTVVIDAQPLFTMALMLESPARDAGDDALAGYDQRRWNRKSGEHVDIGAFELGLTNLPTETLEFGPGGAFVQGSQTGMMKGDLLPKVNPNGLETILYYQYGVTTYYGAETERVAIGGGYSTVRPQIPLNALAPGMTYHYRLVMSNYAGVSYGPDQTITTSPRFARGDFNGNGVVEQDEMDAVFGGYWSNNPTVITNALGLGHADVRLGLENTAAWNLNVMVSEDLVTWSNLQQRAHPVFQFDDPEATNGSVRHYRLGSP